MAPTKSPQRPQKIQLSKVGPVGLTEIELGVRALPE